MASNFLNLKRDIIGKNFHIKGTEVIDEKRNLKNIKSAKIGALQVKKDAEIKGNLSIDGNLSVKGKINACNCDLDQDYLDLIQPLMQKSVDDSLIPAAFSMSTCKCGNTNAFYAGYRDFTNPSKGLMDGDTIFRMASQSKFTGTIGFLKMIDRGLISGTESLANYIPEFAQVGTSMQAKMPGVIDPFTPLSSTNLTNVITATNGSNVLNINETTHGRSNGSVIGIENSLAIQGIPANQINAVHVITVIDANNYTITVTSTATGTSGGGEGGAIIVKTLDVGVKRTSFLGTVYYYKLIPLTKEINIFHVLTHTLGYCYVLNSIFFPFGYAENPIKRNIQCGIYLEKQIPSAVPNPALPLSSQTIQNWVKAIAEIPLLFQPGTEWSYGPTLSILGALIEIIDPTNRDVETYLKQELFLPLGMNDTGFFIQNSDPDRANKVSRIMTMFANPAPATLVPISAVGSLAFAEDYFYGLSQPKTLALIDGGMYSTPNDFQKLLNMLANSGTACDGVKILSPSMMNLLSRNQILHNTIANIGDFRPSSFPDGINYPKFGLGVGVGTASGILSFAAGGMAGSSQRSIGWSGAFNTVYNVDLECGFAVHCGTNLFNILQPSNRSPAIDAGTFHFKLMNLNFASRNSVNVNFENINNYYQSYA